MEKVVVVVWMREREREGVVMVVLEGSVGNIKMREERDRERKDRKEGTRRYCVTFIVEKLP